MNLASCDYRMFGLCEAHGGRTNGRSGERNPYAVSPRAAVGDHHHVDRAHRRAPGDSGDLKPAIGKQMVEHADVKAPCAPPPCSARLIFFAALGCDFAMLAIFQLVRLSR
jgi:hypothetical protein